MTLMPTIFCPKDASPNTRALPWSSTPDEVQLPGTHHSFIIYNAESDGDCYFRLNSTAAGTEPVAASGATPQTNVSYVVPKLGQITISIPIGWTAPYLRAVGQSTRTGRLIILPFDPGFVGLGG